MRQFFDGLSVSPESIRLFFDQILEDLSPQTTRELSAWEDQFGLLPSDQSDSVRRARLSAAWRTVGGQSPKTIQDTLQAAGFLVYVHEWWGAPTKDPTAILSVQGTVFVGEAGQAVAECGQIEMQCGNTIDAVGTYALVNNAPRFFYRIPSDVSRHPYFLYIGGQTFPNIADIPSSRRGELETLILKIVPAQQWVGMLINYI